ncbi:MAG TPA: CBASS cGAMP-activated phospholipase [Bryobacteraceae bacterium]|nr:CBASS cGAMP-activated phospholipase [Bryobacteraceae bacterium]
MKPLKKSRPNPHPPFRILSLDGGGIRGAFAAAFLARIEQELSVSITDYFDLVAGTSTGAIIALALGFGESAERIRSLYEKCGPQIFARRTDTRTPALLLPFLALAKLKFPALDGRMLKRSKYASEPLREALTDVFGNKTLESATACRLVIPAVDLVRGKTVTFKTPHQPDFVRDRKYTAVEVALATTAAPTFFPNAAIGKGTAFSDGGLWANNPAIIAYAEALKIREVCLRPGLDRHFAPEDIWMLSIGTGEPQYYARPRPADDGLFWWGPRLFDVASGAQSHGTHFQARYLMGEERYLRVDFKMPTPPWQLDDIKALPEIFHCGQESAIEHFQSLRSTFFGEKKMDYHPF